MKQFKPITPGLRHYISLERDGLSQDRPEKALVRGKVDRAGRANGRISVRRRGGGHKKLLRDVDFKRDKFGIEGVVKTIEYDPNRTARLALVYYRDGEKRYILAPKGLRVGDVVSSGPNAEIKVGNALPLENIPIGRNVHNVELVLGKGGQLARSAGAFANLAAIEGDYAVLKLPSGEVRMVFKKCIATIGEVGNEDHINEQLGKAGRNRWLGNRPKVRGVAMNPVDHPLGGGEGRSSGGRHPVSPWGQPTRGFKTRAKSNKSNRFIISRRK